MTIKTINKDQLRVQEVLPVDTETGRRIQKAKTIQGASDDEGEPQPRSDADGMWKAAIEWGLRDLLLLLFPRRDDVDLPPIDAPLRIGPRELSSIRRPPR